MSFKASWRRPGGRQRKRHRLKLLAPTRSIEEKEHQERNIEKAIYFVRKYQEI
jgi:predicted nucleotidyltransferase